MAKKKREKFSVTKAVKAAARNRVGLVKPTREIPDAKSREKKRAVKHKKPLAKLLSEE